MGVRDFRVPGLGVRDLEVQSFGVRGLGAMTLWDCRNTAGRAPCAGWGHDAVQDPAMCVCVGGVLGGCSRGLPCPLAAPSRPRTPRMAAAAVCSRACERRSPFLSSSSSSSSSPPRSAALRLLPPPPPPPPLLRLLPPPPPPPPPHGDPGSASAGARVPRALPLPGDGGKRNGRGGISGLRRRGAGRGGGLRMRGARGPKFSSF